MEDTNDISGSGKSNRLSAISRRDMMKATAGAGALAAGASTGLMGNASAAISSFDKLSVSSDNRIVDESGNTFKMRGLNIPDPKRLEITENIRGKTRKQIINLITNNEAGWHPRVIRVPAQPADIGEHPNGNTGEPYGEDSPPEIDNDRTKMIPAQPVEQDNGRYGAFTQEQLDTYLEEHLDPVVEHCAERGVYCIVDFHRHWHEQPPGDNEGGRFPDGAGGSDGAAAENHLPYNSKNTLYWAHNEYYDKDKPMSWGYVDQAYRNNNGPLSSTDDLSGTPYAYDQWQVNEPLVDEAVWFWETVAERYADMDHVIYEPYNEPTAPGIWGPVSGCYGSGDKQEPLWRTYRKQFAQPILEAVREGAPDKLVLMGLPGWCQATQALHWGGFDEEGFENIAAVWHNYAGHGTSQEQNWLNEAREDDRTDCTGWEPAASQGLQEAMDVHPIAVTEFGWQSPEYTNENTENETDISKWLQGTTTGKGTTAGYGKPVIDAMETDDRISWVAWCADPRWLTAMFKVDFPIAEKTLELNNGSWYETDESEYPVNCEPEDMPCDWALWDNPNMGMHIKNRLAEYKDDGVPFDMSPVGPGPTDDGPTDDGPTDTGDLPPVGDHENPPTDPDGDGEYEDLTGNGQKDPADVVTLFEEKNSDAVQNHPDAYDFSGNGDIEVADVVELFGEI